MVMSQGVREKPKLQPSSQSGPTLAGEELEGLGPLERRAVRLLRFVNSDPRAKALQSRFLNVVGTRWVHLCTYNLVHVDGLEKVLRLDPPAGVILAANHRSFFDSYIISGVLLRETRWAERLQFPVRSNFFYESWTGVAINLLIGGGAMYPPIFRDSRKAAYNKDALAWLQGQLERRGTVIGMHPEGTRGKGPDPYELLPAQPGVGQIIVRSGALVVPVFINGLGNSFTSQVSSNFRGGAAKGDPIIITFGDPVDLSAFAGQTPRPALYKRVADRVLDDIRKLGAREREVRADVLRTWR